jgi:hypothetical protein
MKKCEVTIWTYMLCLQIIYLLAFKPVFCDQQQIPWLLFILTASSPDPLTGTRLSPEREMFVRIYSVPNYTLSASS